MRNKRIFILLGLFMTGCYTNTFVQLPISNNSIKPSSSVLVNPTSIPIVAVTPSIQKTTPSPSLIDKEIQSSLKNDIKPTPIPAFLPTNTQPLLEPSNYGIACTPADFSSLPKNNLNEVYNPDDPKHKINIKTFLELRGEIIIFLGFKNLYKIRQLSLLTKKEEDKFTFVSQSCFDTTKLNNIIKNSSTRIIYDNLNDRTVDDIISSESNLTLGEEVLSRLSKYSLVFKAEPTEEGYKKANDFILKLREIEAFKYIETNGLGTTS